MPARIDRTERSAGKEMRLRKPPDPARDINQRRSRMHSPTVTSGAFRLSRSDFVQRRISGRKSESFRHYTEDVRILLTCEE